MANKKGSISDRAIVATIIIFVKKKNIIILPYMNHFQETINDIQTSCS